MTHVGHLTIQLLLFETRIFASPLMQMGHVTEKWSLFFVSGIGYPSAPSLFAIVEIPIYNIIVKFISLA